MGINQGRLPPRHKDPQLVALEELLRQKRRPEAYMVTLSKPAAPGQRPKIWKCRTVNDCGMVTLGVDTFVTGEPITLTAGITPGVDNMFYVWTVAPVPAGGFNCRTEPVDNRITLRCPAAGRFLVSVRGQSGDTSVLGHTSQQVVVGAEAGEVARAAQLKAAYEAARKPGTAKLHLSLATVEPKAVVPLTWSATGNISDAAWISMVANDTPHDDIRANTSRNITSRMIGPERSGTMRFTTPDKPGTYDLRFNDPTSERELASVSFRVEARKRPEKPTPPPAQTAPPSSTTAAQIVTPLRAGASAGRSVAGQPQQLAGHTHHCHRWQCRAALAYQGGAAQGCGLQNCYRRVHLYPAHFWRLSQTSLHRHRFRKCGKGHF
jgi:hypothetical protein